MAAQRVLKFGGTALADGAAVERACRIVAGQGGERPVVVVSAHHGVTDLLERVVRAAAAGRIEAQAVRIRHRGVLSQLGLSPELCDRHLAELFQLLAGVRERGVVQPAELDFALSFGERMSARIVARALDRAGISATPVDAFDLGFTTDSNHGRARLLEGSVGLIAEALTHVPGAAVVTGFLAKDRRGNLTTLGRNGSDVTAAIVAEAIGAAEVQYWKTVAGILTADPALEPDARVIERLSSAEAAELAFHGATVLHPDALAPALRARTRVRVLDVENPAGRGTVLEPELPPRGAIAIACRPAVVRLELELAGRDDRDRRLARLFGTIASASLAPAFLSVSADRACAVVDDAPRLAHVLAQWPGEVRVERDLALLAAVGAGAGRDVEIGRRGLDLLEARGVTTRQAFLGSRECSQVFLVSEPDRIRALHALHAGLLEFRALAG